MEEKLISERNKHKIFLLVVKVIPMVIAFIFAINIILSYFNIEIKAFNYIAGVSILPLIMFYALSYLLHFCEYHRIFLHYIVIINCISLYDEYYKIPFDDFTIFQIYSIITIISLFLILYFKKIRR